MGQANSRSPNIDMKANAINHPSAQTTHAIQLLSQPGVRVVRLSGPLDTMTIASAVRDAQDLQVLHIHDMQHDTGAHIRNAIYFGCPSLAEFEPMTVFSDWDKRILASVLNPRKRKLMRAWLRELLPQVLCDTVMEFCANIHQTETWMSY